MPTRRVFLKTAGIATAFSTASTISSSDALAAPDKAGKANPAKAAVRFDDSVPVVNTGAGPIRGYIRNGIHTFKGIPYGASTAGKNRFMPTQKPEPWSDVLNTVAYGYGCLQKHGDDWHNPVSHFVMDFDPGMMSENCLSLNVWTQGLDSGKRPVLVWIHGGGFQNGSSYEMRPYDGENIVRRGDIVWVSVNHRLNVLGFLDLSTAGGPQFASSANVGMLDLVAALEWVKENIAKFGGDPANVTICGQSGGGGKVNALMRMPSARGLFHKAIVQSGSFKMYRDPKDSSRVGEELVKNLGIDASDLSKLQELPYDKLLAATDEAAASLRRQSGEMTPMMGRFGWAPTADGKVILANDSDDLSSGIPLIVGYTRNEMATSAFDPSVDNLTMDQAKARIAKMHPGEKGSALIAEYEKQYPNCKPAFLYSVIASMMFANGSVVQAEERAAKTNAAPAYAYRFDWCPEIYDGKLGAFHSLEIAFVFDNTDRWDSATGGGPRAQNLATRMSKAWINFARHGDPNHAQLPNWPPYSTTNKDVMIFNDTCRVLSAPDGKAHEILQAAS